MLGVAPDSSHDEVKRAFTTRALKYHPDRQPSGEAREHAAWRMREINQAWETLRNPAARAAYDAKLRGELEARSPALAGAGTRTVLGESGYQPAGRTTNDRSATWLSEPEVAEIEPVDESEDEPEATRWRAWYLGPLAIGAAVLVLVLVLLWRTNNYDDRPNTVQTRERLGEGACVSVSNVDGEQTAYEVPCSSPNSGKVVAKVEFPKSCPQHTVNVVLIREKVSLCLQR